MSVGTLTRRGGPGRRGGRVWRGRDHRGDASCRTRWTSWTPPRRPPSWRFEHQNTLVKQLPTTYERLPRLDPRPPSRRRTSTTRGVKVPRAQQPRGGGRHHQPERSRSASRTPSWPPCARAGWPPTTRGSARRLRSFHQLQQPYLRSHSDTYLQQVASGLRPGLGGGARSSAPPSQRNGTSALGVARSLQQVGLSVKQLGSTTCRSCKTSSSSSTRPSSARRRGRELHPVAEGPGAGDRRRRPGGREVHPAVRQGEGAKRAVIQTNAPQQAGRSAASPRSSTRSASARPSSAS